MKEKVQMFRWCMYQIEEPIIIFFRAQMLYTFEETDLGWFWKMIVENLNLTIKGHVELNEKRVYCLHFQLKQPSHVCKPANPFIFVYMPSLSTHYFKPHNFCLKSENFRVSSIFVEISGSCCLAKCSDYRVSGNFIRCWAKRCSWKLFIS